LNVGKAKAPFAILKSVLCLRSAYFRATFEGGFQEKQTQTTNIPDIEPEHFALVLQWFYTGNVAFSDGTKYIGFADEEKFFEALEMFLFANQYDTKALRVAIFNIFATSMFSDSLKMTLVAKSLPTLPETSGLYKLFSDMIVYEWKPKDVHEGIEVASYLPTTVVGRLFFKRLEQTGLTGMGEAPYHTNMCQYHEHLEDFDRAVCKIAMEVKRLELKNELVAHEKLSRR
jgi:hypothetical protein